MFSRVGKLRSITPLTAITILIVIVATYAIYQRARTNYEKATQEELSGLLNTATFNINQWLDSQKQHLRIEASSPLVRQVFQGLAP
ncbi:MAG: hypothetical protein KAI28_09785, partial [Sphingomonadales bacterium]|nr:hypothetical protein [Sphingomonadales bacterium]